MVTPDIGVEQRYNRMPQWRLEAGIYFITWHLQNALDSLSGTERSIVSDSLHHFHGVRYHLAIFVIMDDHVHVLLQTLPGFDLSKILLSVKTFSATRIIRLRGVTGPRWQKSNYTELLRNEAAVDSRRQYVFETPRRRWGMDPAEYQWLEQFA